MPPNNLWRALGALRKSPVLASALVLTLAIARAEETDDLEIGPIAAAFGAAPLAWGLRLSPDGERVSLIQMHPSGVSVARVVDIAAGTTSPLVAGSDDDRGRQSEVVSCGWANETRLVCNARLYVDGSTESRMVAVDSDGSDLKWLGYGRVIDYLPDDPDRVVVASGRYSVHMNIYNGAVTDEVTGPSQTISWITDGRGTRRVYVRLFGTYSWYVRETPSADWSLLYEAPYTDLEDGFALAGFGERPDELLVYDDHDGRDALFAIDLAQNRARRLVYAHERFDIAGLYSLGKYRRPVAVSYIDDRRRFEFLDARIAQLYTDLQARFAGRTIRFFDEDWSQRYYLIFVDTAEDPGTYYRFDSERNALLKVVSVRPQLADRELAPVREVTYAAADGTLVPAYLTLPKGTGDMLPPAVLLPHDGPDSRDHLTFDFLAQYLAAIGYAVLQSNYRGSSGYGNDWSGEGGYRDWRRAVGDISDGAKYLAEQGIADANRICIVGWGYGGYAALMSAIETPGLYRCVASIAGISELRSHGAAAMRYLGGEYRRELVGRDEEALDAGSPLHRVGEIAVPVLLFHGDRDNEVVLRQSTALAAALERAEKDVELVRYEFAEHDIDEERYRIDMLTRLAAFLGEHLAERPRAR